MIPMLSKSRIRRMITKINELEAENILLTKKNAELEAKLLTTETDITAIKDDLIEIKEISITPIEEPIIKK